MPEKKKFNWGPALFLIIYQVALLVALPFYFASAIPSLGVWLFSVALLYLTGISITGGYHRFYAHRSYRTNPFVESVILFFGTMAAQGSALRWAFDHRQHHAFVDTDRDPYSIKKGFWYAHFLWIMEKPPAIDSKVVPDLMRNKMVQFQHNWYPLLMVATNAMAFFLVAWACNDYWGAFFIALWLRLFALHHFTWFINSLAHTWGDKPFCQEQTAVDNYFLALLTFGEGYHNYHHTFANDYRNGIRWFHFDPTKWVIWTLQKLGLAHSLKRVDAASIKKRMVLERKNLLLEQIKEHWHTKKDELAKQVDEMSERLLETLSQLAQLKEKYQQLKMEVKELNREHTLLQDLKKEMKSMHKALKDDWRKWAHLSESIMQLKSVPA